MVRANDTDPIRVNRCERGFTLIEVMFALVYVAVGLLGVAAMQDIAISKNVDGRRLGIATGLAVEMIERIRFNAPANSTTITGVGLPYHNIKACNFACSGGESAGNTQASTTARGDYDQWRAHLRAADASGVLLLPNATATVTSTAITNPAALGQVRIDVTVTYTVGVRTPTVTMSTVVAPL